MKAIISAIITTFYLTVSVSENVGQGPISGKVLNDATIIDFAIPDVLIIEVDGIKVEKSDKEFGTYTIPMSDNPWLFIHPDFISTLIQDRNSLKLVKLSPLSIFNEYYNNNSDSRYEIKGIINSESNKPISDALVYLVGTPYKALSNISGEFFFEMPFRLKEDLFKEDAFIAVVKEGFYSSIHDLNKSKATYRFQIQQYNLEDMFTLINSAIHHLESEDIVLSIDILDLQNNISDLAMKDASIEVFYKKEIFDLSQRLESFVIKLNSIDDLTKLFTGNSAKIIELEGSIAYLSESTSYELKILHATDNALNLESGTDSFNKRFNQNFKLSIEGYYKGDLSRDINAKLEDHKLIAPSYRRDFPFSMQLGFLPFIPIDAIGSNTLNMDMGLNWWPEKQQVWKMGLNLFKFNIGAAKMTNTLTWGGCINLTRTVINDYKNDLSWGVGFGYYFDKINKNSLYFHTPFEFLDPFNKLFGSNADWLEKMSLSLAYGKIFLAVDPEKSTAKVFSKNYDIFKVSLIKYFGEAKNSPK